MPTTLTVQNQTLIVFQFEDRPLFESSEIAALLGYKQTSSLRKQTLTDWKSVFDAGTHYVLVHDESLLRRYEKERQEAHNSTLVAAKPARGRLFFTSNGMLKVLNRTSKPSEELRSVLLREGYFKNIREPAMIKDRVISEKSLRSKEDRVFEYGVMQKLLEQLERLEQPQLRRLAITAAEVALDRKLEELRNLEGTRRSPPKVPTGSYFTQEGFYSMTFIGKMAGAYTAVVAGRAADRVAAAMGYSHDQIRYETLPINYVTDRPDSSTGKKRTMVRFTKTFANRVVMELRSNPEFRTRPLPEGPTLMDFTACDSKKVPLLSRGPFDDDPTH